MFAGSFVPLEYGQRRLQDRKTKTQTTKSNHLHLWIWKLLQWFGERMEPDPSISWPSIPDIGLDMLGASCSPSVFLVLCRISGQKAGRTNLARLRWLQITRKIESTKTFRDENRNQKILDRRAGLLSGSTLGVEPRWALQQIAPVPFWFFCQIK